jgi:hypothetical protein
VLHRVKSESVASVDVGNKLLIGFLVARCVREVEAHEGDEGEDVLNRHAGGSTTEWALTVSCARGIVRDVISSVIAGRGMVFRPVRVVTKVRKQLRGRDVRPAYVQQNGSLSHPQELDGPMRVAAQRKTNAYKQTYANNQNISFLPAIMRTSNRMHGEFLRLLFLQAHRETEAHFTAAGMPSQRNQSESFRFKRAAFYEGLKSKVGLAAAKAAALRINLNVQGCSIVPAPMHAASRTSLLLPLLLSHNLPLPRVH